MENETVGLWKSKIGMVHLTKFCAVDGPGMALLSSSHIAKCGNTATTRHLGNGNQQVPWGRWWCLRRALRESLSVVEKSSLGRLTFWLHFLPRGPGIHCTLIPVLFLPNDYHIFGKFDRLMAVTDLVLLDIKEINDNHTKLWPAIPIKRF